MKSRLDYRTKRIAIIVVLAIILLIIAIVGSYFFIKSNTETRAADIDDMNKNEEIVTGEVQSENAQNEQAAEIETNEGESNTEAVSVAQENSAEPAVSRGNLQTTNETLQENTTTRTETQIIENKTTLVGFNQEDITIDENALSNINTTLPLIDKELSANKLNGVFTGSEIIYEIKTTKNEIIDQINISALIPEGTELVADSISDNGIYENGRISWKVDANTDKIVRFTVKVTADEGTILANAVVEGKETNIIEIPILKALLTVDKTEVSKNETLTYTISIENTSNIQAEIDTEAIIPENTQLVTEGLNVKDETIIWNETLEELGKTEYSYTVKVNKYEKNYTIENTVKVNGEETNKVISTTVDLLPPTITVKDGYVGDKDRKIFSKVSFELSDENGVIAYKINDGEYTTFTVNNTSDVNFDNIKSSLVYGKNTITIKDVAENEATYEFTYDNKVPTVTVKDGYVGDKDGKIFSNVSFKLSDKYGVIAYKINDGKYTTFNVNSASDANFGNIKSRLVYGTNTITLRDVAGNETTYEFTYDNKAPKLTRLRMLGGKSTDGELNGKPEKVWYATDGHTIRVYAQFDEDLATLPKLKINESIEVGFKSGKYNSGETYYVASYTIKEDDGLVDGTISVEISGYKDIAGNTGKTLINDDMTVAGQRKVIIDKTAPTVKTIVNIRDGYEIKIEPSEKIQKIEGFNDNGDGTYTKQFNNIPTNLTIKDIAGNTTVVPIVTENKEYKSPYTTTGKNVYIELSFNKEVTAMETLWTNWQDVTNTKKWYTENGDKEANFKDKQGNITTVLFKVTMVDSIKPTARIELYPANNNSYYTVALFANEAINTPKDFELKKLEGYPDKTVFYKGYYPKEDSYTVEIEIMDLSGNTNIVEVTIPSLEETLSIELKGDKKKELLNGEEYVEEGYTVSGYNQVESDITVETRIDNETENGYDIIYTATDKYNNTRTITRTIVILSQEETEKIIDTQVKIALNSTYQRDIDRAKTYINRLPDGDLKTESLKKLTDLEERLALEKLIKNATQRVNNYLGSGYPRDLAIADEWIANLEEKDSEKAQELKDIIATFEKNWKEAKNKKNIYLNSKYDRDYDIAKEYIEKLPEGLPRKNLLKEINELKNKLKEEENLRNAKNRINAYEGSGYDRDIDYAKAAIEVLSEENKVEMNKKLDEAIERVNNAKEAVSNYEKNKTEENKSAAISKVNLLINGHLKNNLLSKLGL